MWAAVLTLCRMTTPAADQRPCECSRYSALTNARLGDAGALTWDGDPKRTDCPGTPTKGKFAPGHDAKLKSFLIDVGSLGALVRHDSGAVTDAGAVARRFGFGSQVAAGIAKRLTS